MSEPLRRIGNYQLRKLIGRGGMGEVHLAWDENLQRNVAIKLIRDELSDQPNRLRRLSREARTVAQLNHPGIVHLYHVIPTDNSQALVMEWVEGETLRDLLRRRKSLPTSEAIPIFLQLTEALSFAHEAGFVHRDLKPQNIMITESQQAKILDFGLAKSLGPDLSTLSDEGKILGTFSFMSPEQTAGEDVGAASDLFSLGVVFYETVTGQRPFDGRNVAETLNRICHKNHLDPREITPELPDALALLINDMLEKAAYRRPKNAAEIGNMLKNLDDLKRDPRPRRPASAASQSSGCGRPAAERRPGKSDSMSAGWAAWPCRAKHRALGCETALYLRARSDHGSPPGWRPPCRARAVVQNQGTTRSPSGAPLHFGRHGLGRYGSVRRRGVGVRREVPAEEL